MIEIKNLTKKFDSNVALNRMNCSISEGTIFGLAGSNGSGKSTLLRTLSGVYEPDEGPRRRRILPRLTASATSSRRRASK